MINVTGRIDRIAPILIIAIAWTAAPIVVARVVRANALAGIYGIEDAIAIPIGNAILYWLIGLPYFGVLSYRAFKRYRRGCNPFHFAFSRADLISMAIVLPGIVLLALLAWDWWIWGHFLIVCSYAIPMLWLVWVRPRLVDCRFKKSKVPGSG
jgi:hypothetical protein